MNVPPGPSGVSILMNMHMARHQKAVFQNGGDAFLLSWFYEQVRNGGPWDYKKGRPEFENFGNFHYGAVGTSAGISRSVLLRAAGAAQFRAGTTEPHIRWTNWFTSPFGDDPKDQYWIDQGIKYAQSFQ